MCKKIDIFSMTLCKLALFGSAQHNPKRPELGRCAMKNLLCNEKLLYNEKYGVQ